MPSVYDHFHTVADDEIDHLGHASNLAYFGWMQAAALAHSAAQGWKLSDYQRIGAAWVVRSHTIKYLRAAMRGDDIRVRTWVGGMRRSSSMRRFRMERAADAKLLATAETEWAFVDLAKRLPTRIPPELIASFQIVESPVGETP